MRKYHEGDPMIICLPEPGELLFPSESLEELYQRKDYLSEELKKLRGSISFVELEISEKQVELDRIERDIDIRIEENHEKWKKEFKEKMND